MRNYYCNQSNAKVSSSTAQPIFLRTNSRRITRPVKKYEIRVQILHLIIFKKRPLVSQMKTCNQGSPARKVRRSFHSNKCIFSMRKLISSIDRNRVIIKVSHIIQISATQKQINRSTNHHSKPNLHKCSATATHAKDNPSNFHTTHSQKTS